MKDKRTHSRMTTSVMLLEQGFDVFMNADRRAPIDIIAIKGDELLKIAVSPLEESEIDDDD